MTDILPDTTPTIPPFLATLVHDYAQKLLTAGSTWAMTTGAAAYINLISSVNHETTQDLINSAIQVGVGAAGLAASCAWTLIVAYLRKQKMIELKNSTPEGTK